MPTLEPQKFSIKSLICITIYGEIYQIHGATQMAHNDHTHEHMINQQTVIMTTRT